MLRQASGRSSGNDSSNSFQSVAPTHLQEKLGLRLGRAVLPPMLKACLQCSIWALRRIGPDEGPIATWTRSVNNIRSRRHAKLKPQHVQSPVGLLLCNVEEDTTGGW